MFRIEMKQLWLVGRIILLSLFFICSSSQFSNAQCNGYDRVYADSESHSVLGISNAANAVGNNLTNHSSIAIPSLGLSRYQQLNFPQTFTGSEPIHVKLGSSVVLTVGSIAVDIQAYQNNTPVGTPITLSSGIVNLLGGVNVLDVSVPAPSSNYNAVRITVTSLVSIAADLDIYAAYVNNVASSAINCEAVADVITGSTSGVVSALNGVTDANNATDGNLSTYARLRQNVGAAGYVHLTTIYPSASMVGDSVVVVLKVPGSSVLDAGVFANLNVVTYLGAVPVETVPANSSLIGIRLLDATNSIYRFAYPATAAFDRISVQSGGLVTALSDVYIYDVRRTIPKPMLQIDGANVASKSICSGANTTLSVSPTASCTAYNWYDAASGGTLLHTGTSYPRNGLAPGTYHYYVEAVRDGCTATTSVRTPASVTVNPLPTITLGSNPSVCHGALTATLPFSATTETPTSYSIAWANATFSDVIDSPFPSGSSIALTLPSTLTAGTYSGTLTLKNANGCVSSVQNFNVTIHPVVPPPALVISSN